MKPAPYRIETDRLVLRCHELGDAPWYKEMVDESEEILRPFLWWYTGRSLDETVDRLREFRAKFDADEAYVYAVFEDDAPVGGGVLHTRVGRHGLEIGYWVRASALHRGIATDMTAALMYVAFEVCGADRVELHIASGNVASEGVPRRLGIPHEATLRRRFDGPDGEPTFDQQIFTRFRADYDPSAGPSLRAYDGLGRKVADWAQPPS